MMKAAKRFGAALALMLAIFCLAAAAVAQEDAAMDPPAPFSREELTQMLAPIALYPDALLSQILMASTYPIEVIEAERWLKNNPSLSGDALDNALLHLDWEPSVKALCHFPTVLNLMSERIAQTTDLGNAFLAQEEDVMDTVQELRARAYAEGNLNTTTRHQVVVERETISIEPSDPRIIYVPYYNPYHIYGSWRYPAYPPYYWIPSGLRVGRGITYWPGISFEFALNRWSQFDWQRRYIYFDTYRPSRFIRYHRWAPDPDPWYHSPRHRRGIVYRDHRTAERYYRQPSSTRGMRDQSRYFEPPRRSAPEVRVRSPIVDRSQPVSREGYAEGDRMNKPLLDRLNRRGR
ncbi:DUF3300 domain-containing protein [Desulfofustis glycolicus]|uniref:DUF3300 domain-containing protein n=1 Tax=Desulfofustis glycolicus DSM 9705 TaxID=1121409 RepID=A0A1M5VYS2_9BACT|nr:DUF3300 domain-containing protein [Desulfofustis glycolicus]MCB2215168.1 DUF3300 domain-containing protein [Desulfobulbaceae bacterium]SHH80469.1 Protein of unknown function [Desulfofustis glycolicus DSM 9705]